MSRAGILGNPNPYTFFGTFASLPFWPGGLSLLAAAPGLGKTSWLLRMVFEATANGFPAAIGCYEHTPEELKYRLRKQAEALVADAHEPADEIAVERCLAGGSEAVLLSLSDKEDTVRALEDTLLRDYGFPEKGPALLAVDYLNRVPVVGLTGMLSEATRGGEAAALLRELSRRHGWAVIAAAALRSESFKEGAELSSLLGDERVPYEADRVLLMRHRFGEFRCSCVPISIHTLKDRTGPTRVWDATFWGERFFPAIENEASRHGKAIQ
jgi:hypothetical protein